MRFVEIENESVNMDHVRSYYFTQDKLNVVFADGERNAYSVKNSAYVREELAGTRHIVQIVPCAAPLWTVCKIEDEDAYTAERLLLFGLCTDGSVYPLDTMGGYFDIAEGLTCICTDDELSRYPNLTRRAPFNSCGGEPPDIERSDIQNGKE